jgi:CRISPR-associated protein Csm4
MDYTNGKPFMVVSDAFPAGYIPKPTVPTWFYAGADPEKRKLLKKKVWMPLESIHLDLSKWQEKCKSSTELNKTGDSVWSRREVQPHNSINRQTGTTGTGEFAPYSVESTYYAKDALLHCHIVLDEEQFSLESLKTVMQEVGYFGYGKDATIGAGKFEIIGEANKFCKQESSEVNASVTLAPSAPQGLGYDSNLSFYQLFTRFGRHGDIAVHQSGKPFKSPVLMAKAGSVFGVVSDSGFIGQGLGADKQKLSLTIPETVQQGYSPVISIKVSDDILTKLSFLGGES